MANAERQAWGQRRYRIGLEKVYFAPEAAVGAQEVDSAHLSGRHRNCFLAAPPQD